MRKRTPISRHSHGNPRHRSISPLDALDIIQAQLPLCRLLLPIDSTLSDAAGTVLVRQLTELRPGRIAFSILAHALPSPSEFGSYDSYQGLVHVPNIITWVFPLFPNEESPATWAGSYTESTLNPLPTGIAQVRPFNTVTNISGSAILQGMLE